MNQQQIKQSLTPVVENNTPGRMMSLNQSVTGDNHPKDGFDNQLGDKKFETIGKLHLGLI